MTNKDDSFSQQSEKQIITININGQILQYEHEELTYDNITPIKESDARELFHVVKTLFDEVGIKFALCFGTLLGAVRENGHLIKGDEDMDIFVCDEEKLRNNLIWLYEKGLKVCKIYPGVLYSFRINYKCYIDVYIKREINGISIWRLYCLSLSSHEMPRKFFKEYSEIEFLGEKCLCPKDPEKLLEFWYGSNWRIPVRGHKFIYRVKSAHYYHLYVKPKIDRIKNIFKFIFNNEYRQKILQRKKETGSYFYHDK